MRAIDAHVHDGFWKKLFTRDGADTFALSRPVLMVEQPGGTRFVHAGGPDAPPLIAEQRDRPAVGDTVTARFRPADLRVFDSAGPRLR